MLGGGGTCTVDYYDRMSDALKGQLVGLPADEIMEWDNLLRGPRQHRRR